MYKAIFFKKLKTTDTGTYPGGGPGGLSPPRQLLRYNFTTFWAPQFTSKITGDAQNPLDQNPLGSKMA